MATVFTIDVVCSRQVVTETSRFFNDAALLVLDYSILDSLEYIVYSCEFIAHTGGSGCCIRLCIMLYTFWRRLGDVVVCFFFEKMGLSQSDPLRIFTSLPMVRGVWRCSFGGSRCGSVTMDTKTYVPSEGKLRLLI